MVTVVSQVITIGQMVTVVSQVMIIDQMVTEGKPGDNNRSDGNCR
jgi:hypothetical protein